MYAVLIQVDMKQDWTGDRDAELADMAQTTKSLPGFERATWATDGVKGACLIVLSDEAAARELASSGNRIPPEAGVTFRSLDLLEIVQDI